MEQKQIHVAALAFPFGTHAAPLLALVRRLAEAAPSNVIFSFHSTAASNATLFSSGFTNNNNNIRPFDVSDGVPEGYVFSGFRQEGINLFLSAAPGNFSETVTAAEVETGIRVSCLLTDAFLWFCCDLAAEIGVPWVTYWTAAASALSTHFRTDLIREKINGKEEESLKFIPGMSKVEINDLQDGILSGDLTSLFSEMLRKMGLNLPNTTAVVVNSFEELEPIVTLDLKSNLNKFLCVGPANLVSSSPPPRSVSDDDSGCIIQWLDGWGAASVAYVAFGSVAMLPPEEILVLGEALEDARFPFIWSIKDESKRFLPTRFLEKTKKFGKLVSWAPQVEVLKHKSVGVFVTHCGWNSITEGIVGGVPMICRPFFGDQTLNSRMVETEWEIGLKIPTGKFTKSGAVEALKRVLSSEDGGKMRENVRRLRGQAIKAVEPHGSSSANFKTLVEIITNNHN